MTSPARSYIYLGLLLFIVIWAAVGSYWVTFGIAVFVAVVYSASSVIPERRKRVRSSREVAAADPDLEAADDADDPAA